MAKKPDSPGSTPFYEVPLPLQESPKKKRYGPVLDAIHKVERVLAKLTPAESAQVYLHLRNHFQPELSFGPAIKPPA